MRRSAIAAVGVLLVLSAAGFGAEQEKRTVSVTGTAVLETAPDHVMWHASLTDEDVDLKRAKVANDAKVKAVLDAARKLGLKDDDIATGYLSVNRREKRDRDGNVISTYYAVSRSVALRQNDLKRFDEFFDALLGSADMELYFDFRSTRMIEVRQRARLEALKAAREKARVMAETLDAKLGQVLSIEEFHPSRFGEAFASNRAFVESAPPPDTATERFVAGTISVTVSVSVQFELQ